MMTTDLISMAARYATSGHRRINPRHKYLKRPAAVHLKAVTELVKSITDDPETIAGAWLHDLAEETPVTIEDIEREFGASVGQLVADLTDVSKPSDGNRLLRGVIDRAHLAKASPKAKTIKLADIIDNCLNLPVSDERSARIYLKEAMDMMTVLTEGDNTLYQSAQRVINDCEVRLGIPPHPPIDEYVLETSHTKSLFAAHKRLLRLFIHSFNAQDIADTLPSFDKDVSLNEIWRWMEKSQIPVVGIRTEGWISSYIYNSGKESSIKQIRPINKNQILEGDAPLSDVILVLTRQECVFINVFGSISGVITRMNIDKPTVRMWLFGMLTLIESELTNHIKAKYGDQSWKRLISPKRLERAQELLQERNRRNQPGTLVNCLQMADKASIAFRDEKVLAEFGLTSGSEARRAIAELESLRNHLAHAHDIISTDWAQIARMAQNFFRRAKG